MAQQNNQNQFIKLPNAVGPEDPLTLREIFQSILQDALGDVLPMGLDKAISGMLGKFILGALGVKNDAGLDVPLTSGNMSPRGVANSYLMTQARQLAPEGFRQAQSEAELRFWVNFAGIQKSEKAWLEQYKLKDFDEKHTRQDYEDYLISEAISYKNGPASMLYKMTDPYEMNQAATYMSMATSNLYMRQLLQGDRRRPSEAVQFMSRLYTDENGKFAFNREDYGGMGISEVSALTAALTKELDPLSNVRTGDAAALKKAASDFSARVKEYAEALAPLKDIFGKDIPSMLRTVEELSGQSIATTGVEKAQEIARQVSTGVIYGNYTIGDVRGVNQNIIKQFEQMQLSDMSMQQTALLSVDILDAGTENLPKYMRKDRMMQRAYDRVASSAASTGAEYLDRAYAIWAHEQARKDEDASIETFRNQFKGLETGQWVSKAMELARVNTLVELDNGMRYNEYATAKEKRLGASLAVEVASSERVDRGLRALQNRYRDTITERGQSLYDTFGELRKLTADADVNILDIESVAKKLNIEKGSARWDSFQQAINLIHATGNDKNSGNAQYIVGEYTVNRNIALARRRDAREQERTEFLKQLNSGKSSNIKDLIVGVINNRLSLDEVKKALATSGFTSPELARDVVAVSQAMRLQDKKATEDILARNVLRTSITDEKSIKKLGLEEGKQYSVEEVIQKVKNADITEKQEALRRLNEVQTSVETTSTKALENTLVRNALGEKTIQRLNIQDTQQLTFDEVRRTLAERNTEEDQEALRRLEEVRKNVETTSTKALENTLVRNTLDSTTLNKLKLNEHTLYSIDEVKNKLVTLSSTKGTSHADKAKYEQAIAALDSVDPQKTSRQVSDMLRYSSTADGLGNYAFNTALNTLQSTSLQLNTTESNLKIIKDIETQKKSSSLTQEKEDNIIRNRFKEELLTKINANENYKFTTEDVRKYLEKTRTTEQENLQQALADVQIARIMGDDQLKEYYGTETKDDEEQRKVLRQTYIDARRSTYNDETAIRNVLKTKLEDTLIRRTFKTEGDKKLNEIAGKDGLITIAEYKAHLDKARNDAKGKDGKEPEGANFKYAQAMARLNELSNRLSGGPGGTSDTMKVWSNVEPLIRKLIEVLEAVAKVVDKANTTAAGRPESVPTPPAKTK